MLLQSYEMPSRPYCDKIHSMTEDNDKDVSGYFNKTPKKNELDGADFDLTADTKTGKVWLLHGKPLRDQGRLVKAIYNPDTRRLKFVTKDGSIQYLGPDVGDLLHKHVAKAKEICAIHVTGPGQYKDMFVVPLTQERKDEKEL